MAHDTTPLSLDGMQRNHCLDADRLKGCPVDAFTKDPATSLLVIWR
jgi:hypothetical protein